MAGFAFSTNHFSIYVGATISGNRPTMGLATASFDAADSELGARDVIVGRAKWRRLMQPASKTLHMPLLGDAIAAGDLGR